MVYSWSNSHVPGNSQNEIFSLHSEALFLPSLMLIVAFPG
jgi:hypothetical protein